MTFRSDVTVDWTQSPRIVTVASPSVELTIQDAHDTLRRLEERPAEGLAYPTIVRTSGKEALGGGVLVGLTQVLTDARVSFEARKTAAATGTVTTADATGKTLTDSAATFVTAAVKPGSWVVNRTDGSVCTVLRVLSQTQLETDVLGGGSDNQFGSADAYKVYNVVQVEVSGGNLVAVDSLGAELEAILPTAGTQVVRTSSSSATLQEELDLQFSSFDGVVLVDPNNTTGLAQAGTAFPAGTRRQPVLGFTDALAIVAARGLKALHLLGQGLTLDSGLNFSGLTVEGENPAATTITVASAANVLGCRFKDLDIQGTLDGLVTIERCVVRSITMVEGVVEHSRLRGTITLLAGGAQFSLLYCVDDLAGLGTPTIDFGATGPETIVRSYRGGLVMQNKSNAVDVSVDGTIRLVLAATFGGTGTLLVRGIGPVVDNQGTFSNITSQLVSPATVADSVWDEAASGHTIAGSMADRLLKLYELAGLDPTKPLVVTATTRKVPSDGSAINQTVVDASGTVTVTRS